MGDTKKQPYGKFVVKIKRIHESPVAHDGVRVLVDRLWPRGVSKEAARLDAWHKDIAPSTSLREWFGHDSARWEEFQRRYRRELVAQPACVEALRDLARGGTLTLLYAAKDEAHNNAVVLREFLARREQHGSKRAPRKPA
ncbi:MAG: DUF488 domain-containing protein [Planctomycetota bacterium]|nr:DUF488 domain-containing protein [Planctomycetota bacterium]